MASEGSPIVVLQGTKRDIWKFAERQYHQVDYRYRFVVPEEFPDAALDEIASCGVSEAARCDDAEAAASLIAGAPDQRHVAPPSSYTVLLNPEELRATANPFTTCERPGQNRPVPLKRRNEPEDRAAGSDRTHA